MAGPQAPILEQTPADGYVRPVRETYQERMLGYALEAVASRSLVWLVTAGGMAAWGWTVLHPSVLGIVASASYCVSVLVPVLIRDSKGG